MEADSGLVENIKACRTCGIHYVTPSKYQLKHLFQSALEHSEIMLIRLELSQWNVEVSENDGYPQYVCNTCIHKFEQVFELRAACINAQKEFHKFYAVSNNIKIKTEVPDPDEDQPRCDFVYVDDLSDTEYDGATPFNFPHIPIKAEIIEAATIPMEDSQEPTNIVESASKIAMQIGPSSTHILHELIPQNETIALSQPAAIEQEAAEAVECKLCQHSFSTTQEYNQHMQQAHESNDFQCQICGKEFQNSTLARFKFHMKFHSLNKHLKCTLCGLLCSSKDALRDHKRTNHRKLNCKICRKAVLAKKMKLHLRRHELLPKYPCEYCAEVFATEDIRENHIWEIHANEDNNALVNSISSFQTSCTQAINDNRFQEPQEELLIHQDPPDDVLYKFMCAQCEHRFMEQIDLENHVHKEHRAKTNFTSIETEAFAKQSCINETTDTMETEQDVNEHANITVFEEYDDDNDIHIPVNNDSPINIAPFLLKDLMLPSTSRNINSCTNDAEDSETDTASNVSSDDESEGKEPELKATINLSSFVGSNTFACAKCPETFISIEQLRHHYEQHLAADQQHLQHNTAAKSKFKCNLCEKSFDLKFILNRHVKKHKYVPPLSTN